MPKREGRLPIMELFGPTIQGEGIMTGTVTHFLRTGGCGLRCVWCDSMHAVDPKQIRANRTMMTTAEILDAIKALPSAPYITFTGGDPCMHKRLGEIITTLNMRGMQVAIETQGEMFPEWLQACDVVTFSPKGPSSGNVVDFEHLTDKIESIWGLGRKQTRICIKVVIFNEADFKYAMQVYNHMTPGHYDAFYFTAGTPMHVDDPSLPETTNSEVLQERAWDKVLKVLENQRAIADSILAETTTTTFNDKVHVGCQQHVLLWPHETKGV